jgi:hypothetical protein
MYMHAVADDMHMDGGLRVPLSVRARTVGRRKGSDSYSLVQGVWGEF